MALALKALPGRVLLKFPPPDEDFGESGIIRPIGYQKRPEFGEIVDIGAPLDERQKVIAERLQELKNLGIPLCVSFAAGVSYWDKMYDQKKYRWLQDYRTFSIDEPAAFLVEAD